MGVKSWTDQEIADEIRGLDDLVRQGRGDYFACLAATLRELLALRAEVERLRGQVEVQRNVLKEWQKWYRYTSDSLPRMVLEAHTNATLAAAEAAKGAK